VHHLWRKRTCPREGTVSAMTQHDLPALLEQSGARARGNRHDCPKCGGRRTVTHTAECFYCHRCQWCGNVITLAKELGVYKRLTSAQSRELRHNRERADRAARHLYERVKARRFELLDRLHVLGGLESKAQGLGPDNPQTWNALSEVYAERPVILAELTIFENAPVAELLELLSAGAARGRMIDRVLSRGGLCDALGRFVEVQGLANRAPDVPQDPKSLRRRHAP
jgi:hypothetical protein